MADIKIIRRKVLDKMGLAIKQDCTKTENITESVLQPFCLLDIAYNELSQIDKKCFRFDLKSEYKLLLEDWHMIFGREGVLYSGMTEQEIVMLNDYMDKIGEQAQVEIDAIYFMLEHHLMDMRPESRKVCAKLLLCEAVVLFSYYAIVKNFSRYVNRLKSISERCHELMVMLRTRELGKVKADFILNADMFNQVLDDFAAKVKSITIEDEEVHG